MTAMLLDLPVRIGNRLLAAMPRADFDALRPHLEPVSLASKEVLLRARATVTDVYFPEQGMVSMVQPLGDGAPIEVGVIGAEGVVGVPALLGGDRMCGDAVVRIPGRALRLRAHVLQERMRRSAELRHSLHRFLQGYLAQLAQSAACNGRHSLQERLARWLLVAHDHAEGGDLTISHEVLATMLGMRRAGVTVAMGALRNAGLFINGHTRIIVTDRPGLEAAACECYGIVAAEYRRLGL
jgi:CRP-like cAMP-binding protein